VDPSSYMNLPSEYHWDQLLYGGFHFFFVCLFVWGGGGWEVVKYVYANIYSPLQLHVSTPPSIPLYFQMVVVGLSGGMQLQAAHTPLSFSRITCATSP